MYGRKQFFIVNSLFPNIKSLTLFSIRTATEHKHALYVSIKLQCIPTYFSFGWASARFRKRCCMFPSLRGDIFPLFFFLCSRLAVPGTNDQGLQVPFLGETGFYLVHENKAKEWRCSVQQHQPMGIKFMIVFFFFSGGIVRDDELRLNLEKPATRFMRNKLQ